MGQEKVKMKGGEGKVKAETAVSLLHPETI